MKLIAIWFTAAVLGLAVPTAANGQARSSAAHSFPAATLSQFQCAGFISQNHVKDVGRVFDGADNDLYEPLHEFTTDDEVYLRRTHGQSFADGQRYYLVRPETGYLLQPLWLSGMLENQILPPASQYPLQRHRIKSLGRPYDPTGLVRVIKVTPQGAVARVVFSCNGVNVGDIALPYVPQPVPRYVPSARLSRFAGPNGKLTGTIVAEGHAASYLGKGSIAFLSVGRKNGVAPGQKFRIFVIRRYNLPQDFQGSKPAGPAPRETVGELVILRVRQNSSTGVVVQSLRQIAIGDGVEME